MLNIAQWKGGVIAYAYCDGIHNEPLEYRPDHHTLEYSSNGTPTLVLEWDGEESMEIFQWANGGWKYASGLGVYVYAKISDTDGNRIGYSA
jgi:hypothetical protein